jgi:hypothetical protein
MLYLKQLSGTQKSEFYIYRCKLPLLEQSVKQEKPDTDRHQCSGLGRYPVKKTLISVPRFSEFKFSIISETSR